MKAMNWKTSVLIVLIALGTISCGDDEDTPKGAFETGVLVVNEGNFLAANASISHYNISTEEVTDNIFFSNNASTTLGDVAQSAYVEGDVGFIVLNNSAKVEVVDANTFTTITTIDAMLPRYFTTYSGKGYLTEWVSFSDKGRVSVINLNDYSVETTIPTGFGAENIIEANGKLYVSNNFETTVSVIDPSLNEVVESITVRNAPGGFVLDAQGDLWLACGGGFNAEFAPLNNGALYKINTSDNSSTVIELGMNIPTKIAINQPKDALYFLSGNQVFKVATSATTAPSNPFITESTATSFYGVGVNPSTNVLYVGDSKGFQANGSVYRYNANGTSLGSFNSGIGPNGFVFK